jgi:hypothetical protein
VNSHQSLLPTGQAEIELTDHSLFSSLPVAPRWSNMLLISPDGSCVTLWPLMLGQLSILCGYSLEFSDGFFFCEEAF